MRIVLAPDSFKESLTAQQACDALAEGIRAVVDDVEFVDVPMADGGEGTVDALVDATGGERITTTVTGPLGGAVEATWGMLGDRMTAVIEMAAASGLPLVPAELRDARITTTYGTGELVRGALDRGARHLLLGIGGSATNDAGAGFASALGVRFLDSDGHDLPPGGAALAELASIDLTGLDPRLAWCQVEVACDVTNPLCGPNGASAVFGPQKGADPAAVSALDAALARFANVVHEQTGRDVLEVPGAGAAGGLGAGLLAFADATLTSGVGLVARHAGLAERVVGADLVITGEGRVDSQTRNGKTPWGVAQVAHSAGVPVVAVAGLLGDGSDELAPAPFVRLWQASPPGQPLADALAGAHDNLVRCGQEIARWFVEAGSQSSGTVGGAN